MFVKEDTPPDITHQVYYVPSLFPNDHGLVSTPISLEDGHGQTETIPSRS